MLESEPGPIWLHICQPVMQPGGCALERAPGRAPGALGSTSLHHAALEAQVWPVWSQVEPRPGLARGLLVFCSHSGHPSLSLVEPQFPHLDPGMTIPTARKQLWGVCEKVKAYCELEESVVVMAESA